MSNITKPDIKSYLETQSSSINTFRTLVLFGKNTATYKFAFCDALLKLNPVNEIKYDDLRDDFMKELVSHYNENRHQFKSGPTKLTQAMDHYLKGSQSESEWHELLTVAERNIYNNVFDAFQNVGQGTINKEFMLFEHDRKRRKLVVTDNTNMILNNDHAKQIIARENQSRWELVEEAWKAGLSPNLLEYDKDRETFVSITPNSRVNLRSAVDVLLPYQKGRCFYCNRPINRFAQNLEEDFPDVDHFMPLTFLEKWDTAGASPNGVWNLVVSCLECNRGTLGKFTSPPSVKYFNKLKDRNLLFTEEHKHSLRNSILLSMNVDNKPQVGAKMEQIYRLFEHLKGWEPHQVFSIEDGTEL
jgi:hypothetical protein